MKIVFTPDWFLGSDVLIEIFSFLVLFAFFIISMKNYKMSKNRKFLHLGIGFLLIAVAQIATIMTKIILYYDTSFTQTIGQAVVTYNIAQSVDIFYYIGFFIHRFLTLAGLYIIYRLPGQKKFSGDVFLALYFLMISALFSINAYYLFHITALILLVLIACNYYAVYKKNKHKNTLLLVSSFSVLALSQAIYIFSKVSFFYATAELIELVSYISLLFLMIRIQYGKKKKQDGDSIGYAGNDSGKRRKH